MKKVNPSPLFPPKVKINRTLPQGSPLPPGTPCFTAVPRNTDETDVGDFFAHVQRLAPGQDLAPGQPLASGQLLVPGQVLKTWAKLTWVIYLPTPAVKSMK